LQKVANEIEMNSLTEASVGGCTMTSMRTEVPQGRLADDTANESSVQVKIVDTDVHPMLTNPDELKPFLPKRWHHLLRYHPRSTIRFEAINNGSRVDARPESGLPAGSDPKLMKKQLLDEAGVDFAVLLFQHLGNLPAPEADAAWTSAMNEWLASTWLAEYNWHGRYRGSIRVAAQSPDAAVREIHRWADDPRFVEVLAVHQYQPAFGHPMYEPIWRAAAEHGLPVAMHVSAGQIAATQHVHPFGHPSYMFEWHAGLYPISYAAHAASLVCSGIFERIPELRFVMVEGGISWSLPLENHLDRNWRLLRSEVPQLKLLPSEYMHRHMWFTTQPVEESYDSRDAVLDVWEQLDADRRVMFSSDYPHWDYDDPKLALPRMSKNLRRRIMAETACELYGLPRERPATDGDS
jgi:predicted TIM-barrel fold metal-dependent hydrolase